MKNIHILPTDQPSRLHYYFELNKRYGLSKEPLNWRTASHIYITSDEDIKEGDFAFFLNYNTRHKAESKKGNIFYADDTCKKIILTTDPTLIAEGVQSIDDEFLEWFIRHVLVLTKDLALEVGVDWVISYYYYYYYLLLLLLLSFVIIWYYYYHIVTI